MAKGKQGFASMSAAKLAAVGRKGGRLAHLKGTAHEWTSAEARAAGLKGGRIAQTRRREKAASRPQERS